ncbi:aldo/keto reductase [Stella sp.]|uniref:aldo/keto reductase n=1 Tax=Stella sp. TaxID=2912054 RepID=UPI0035B18E6E
MEYRQLGGSGFMVPALSFGTATFGGGTDFFRAWGATDVAEAERMIDLCLDAGLNMFDSADAYSLGLAEEILGQAIKGKRDRLLISTKATFRVGQGPNDVGSSRHHLMAACDASLKRLGTDHIDLWQMHGFDAMTPIEETMRALDDLVRAGKVRYVGCSNFSGWHLMKAQGIADRHGWTRYVAHQLYYSLVAREYEWELMPLGIDQKVGAVVWSPLAGGRLSGKLGRNRVPGKDTRYGQLGTMGPEFPQDQFYDIVDVLYALAEETGRTVPQVALNWVLRRPTVSTVIVGARNEAQLRENLGAVDFVLTPEQVARLDEASHRPPIYPYWHQRRTSTDRNPPLFAR